MKIIKFIADRILFIYTLILLAFIPLYPKLPFLDVAHTWVYIRFEDLLIAGAWGLFFVQLFRKKATLSTPLTIPIVAFWAIGALSTLYAVVFIFPTLADVFPNVAWFHYLRRVEYLSLFFIAFSAIKSKRDITAIISVVAVTLLFVVLYGFGQKGILIGWESRFYAFSTMNEEFAKGIPLQLSSLARVPSTFAGHYDLAAYLVMMIPLLGSMIFGFRKWYVRISLFLLSVSGLILLMMTSSRVSFAVYLLTISFMLILQKKKWFIIPVIIGSILLSNSFDGISERFGNTISQVDVVVDARTGKAIGIAKADPTGKDKVIIEDKTPTGEELPQGSGYISLPSTDEGKSVTEVTYKRTELKAGKESTQVSNLKGEYVIKRVFAYDLSFTTRFQGTWPRALKAFFRNPLSGSGYSSISLATDNNYLRLLGEVGVLGFITFGSIFLVFGVYVRRILPDVDDNAAKSFVIGVVAAIFGVALNAVLIDVFEASKVAFIMWILIGLTVGILRIYQKKSVYFLGDIVKVLLSTPALMVYLVGIAIFVFSPMVKNYFVGDDFTWLRWAADCKKVLFTSGMKCEPGQTTIISYFTSADGFFYRPGTKLYFYFMYPIFSLTQHAYHIVSMSLHIVTTIFVMLLANKILKNRLFGFIAALMFLVLSAHSEMVYWISATGHIMTAATLLSGLVFYIYWRESKKWIYFVLSVASFVISPLFHELGIVGPILVVAYSLVMAPKDALSGSQILKVYLPYLLLIPTYLLVRFVTGSHGLSGDYNYSLLKLPFNVFGNILGYVGITFFDGPAFAFYNDLREAARTQYVLLGIVVLLSILITILIYRFVVRSFSAQSRRLIVFSLALFVITLLPFLGLGNITYRYVYLASAGLLILIAFALMQLFNLLKSRVNRLGAFLVISLLVTFFSVWQVNTLWRVSKDWLAAGVIAERVLLTFNQTYAVPHNYTENPVFYFANVPIKVGEAWIFPVGLEDALWFTFQNEHLTVNQISDVEVGLDAKESSASAKVFEFDKNGTVYEVIRTTTTTTVKE